MANYDYFLKFFEEFEFPSSNEITDKAEAFFGAANDSLRMYRGDYRELMHAFQLFIASGCRPFVYLGAAAILVDASYISGNQYERNGLLEAQKFLDKAREIIPARIEVDIQQAWIYQLLKEKAKFKAAVDELAIHPDAESSYNYATMQMDFYEEQKNVPQIEFWHKKAMERAKTDVQRLFALNRLASCHLMLGNYAQSIPLYEQVVKIDPNDPWAWHNMSIMVMKRKEYARAGQYNRNALNIMEFGNAFKILDDLVNIWRPNRHVSLVQEVPRYLSHESMEKKERGLFGKLFGDS
jgi:tetratricopeptide (TPR) repeat protein